MKATYQNSIEEVKTAIQELESVVRDKTLFAILLGKLEKNGNNIKEDVSMIKKLIEKRPLG